MDATSNPQTAAEQARKNYQDVTTPGAAVPENVRAMVEKAVDQSREVYDRSKDALDASVATLERTFDAAGQGVVAFNRKIIEIAQRNVNSGFDLAKSLAGGEEPCRGYGIARSLLAQAVRCTRCPSRRGSRALNLDGGRRERATQGAGETRRRRAAQGKLNGFSVKPPESFAHRPGRGRPMSVPNGR